MMKSFLKVTKALSDPSRVKILKMLQQRRMCVCEITEALQIAQSTASNHLNKLESAALVSRAKDGLWVNYWLNENSENPYARKMLFFLSDLLEDDPEIADLLERLPLIQRDHVCRR